MVNPVKFLYKATGLQNILDKGGEGPPPAQAPAITPTAAPPSTPPLVGQEPAPKKTPDRNRTFAPSIISGATTQQSGGGKTLLGQ